MDMLELGTKIIGNFGAMHPLREGEVDNISYKVRASNCIINKEVTDYMVKVKWDNGSHTWMLLSEIDAGDTNRAGIGYFTEEAYYEN